MHTIKCGDTVFNFNSDLSGDVTIKVGADEIEVPGAHILEFVAIYARSQRVIKLDAADDTEILADD